MEKRRDSIIGAGLKQYAAMRNWSQRKLADFIGEDHARVSRWWNGMGANEETLIRVAESLSMTPAQFVAFARGESPYAPHEERWLMLIRAADPQAREYLLRTAEAVVDPSEPDEPAA